MLKILEDAGEKARPWMDDSTIMVTAARLATIKDTLNSNWRDIVSMKAGGVNSLLFFLISSLEVCLVRIEDADRILCGSKAAAARSRKDDVSNVSLAIKNQSQALAKKQQRKNRAWRWIKRITVSGCLGGTIFYAIDKSKGMSDTNNQTIALKTTAKWMGLFFGMSVASRRYEMWRLRHRLADSVASLAMWQQKWIIVNGILDQNNLRRAVSYNKLICEPSDEDSNDRLKSNSRKLLECIPIQSNKGAFWYSQGALRLLIVRRVMDLIYASVGTAIDTTGPSGCCGLWVPLAGLSATYYAIAGSEITSHRASRAVMMPTMDFIKRAWGLVSYPPVKWLAFEASKLLKGLKVAERVVIAGVPCLVISKSARPSVTAAIARLQRQHKRRKDDNLTDIVEDASPGRPVKQRKQRANSFSNSNEDVNVILHVTGGGWFIHSTATDVSFLSEWSEITNSVIIIPEYKLLPEFHFPVAINEIFDVYVALSSGQAGSQLGFNAEKIVVSGESAGGNMAAALIVKLIHDGVVDLEDLIEKKKEKEGVLDEDVDDEEKVTTQSPPPRRQSFEKIERVRLPDGLLMSCPVLNMCLSMSPSRVMGTGDPVLPSGLIQMVSKEYIPDSLGIEKSHPIASPYHASDEILSVFPRTLMWVSSSDPLLDDSVDFNTKLRRVGVDSQIHCARHLPHAFLGLKDVGFPESAKIHKSCTTFLIENFNDVKIGRTPSQNHIYREKNKK